MASLADQKWLFFLLEGVAQQRERGLTELVVARPAEETKDDAWFERRRWVLRWDGEQVFHLSRL